MDQYCEKEQFSFIDYVSNGFELNFMVAVDFTGKEQLFFYYSNGDYEFNRYSIYIKRFICPASNGNPLHSDSLHYIDAHGRLNSYQKVNLISN